VCTTSLKLRTLLKVTMFEVVKSIEWIVIRTALTNNSSVQKRLDMTTLMKSLLQISQDGDLLDDLLILVANYNGDAPDEIQTIVDKFETFYDINEMRVSN
jgi:hypothetical protein